MTVNTVIEIDEGETSAYLEYNQQNGFYYGRVTMPDGSRVELDPEMARAMVSYYGDERSLIAGSGGGSDRSASVEIFSGGPESQGADFPDGEFVRANSVNSPIDQLEESLGFGR